jgi:hypothetical protein
MYVGDLPVKENETKEIIIDKEGKDYMKHAAKICRKLKCCHISFLPEASIWMRRAQVYCSIIQFHKGKIRNKGNLKWAARRCTILNLFGFSMSEILTRLEGCKSECKFYQENSKQFRAAHFNKQLHLAQKRGDNKAAEKITTIIAWEKQRSFWRQLNFIMGKQCTKIVTLLQVPQPSGLVTEPNTKDKIKDSIFSEALNK